MNINGKRQLQPSAMSFMSRLIRRPLAT